MLDEPLAAMGAREGALIIELIQELKQRGDVSMIVIAHNYVHVLDSATGSPAANGRIKFDKRTGHVRRRMTGSSRTSTGQALLARHGGMNASSSFGNPGTGPKHSFIR